MIRCFHNGSCLTNDIKYSQWFLALPTTMRRQRNVFSSGWNTRDHVLWTREEEDPLYLRWFVALYKGLLGFIMVLVYMHYLQWLVALPYSLCLFAIVLAFSNNLNNFAIVSSFMQWSWLNTPFSTVPGFLKWFVSGSFKSFSHMKILKSSVKIVWWGWPAFFFAAGHKQF